MKGAHFSTNPSPPQRRVRTLHATMASLAIRPGFTTQCYGVTDRQNHSALHSRPHLPDWRSASADGDDQVMFQDNKLIARPRNRTIIMCFDGTGDKYDDDVGVEFDFT
jgi:hypothetical protein